MTTPEAPTSMAAAIETGVQTGNEFNGVQTQAPQESNDDDSSVADSTIVEGQGEGDDSTRDSGVPAGTAPDKVVPDGQDPAAGDVPAVGADGKPAAPAAAGKPVPASTAKTPEQIEAERIAAAAKTPDPINDPIPNALKGPTKERIKSLITTVKAETERANKVQTSLDTIVQRVQSTGSSPEQYSQALQYLQLVNSGDRAQILKALEFMEGERIALARMAGVPLSGVSMLADYPDLEAEVHSGKLTPARAEEIAAGRAATEHQANANRHADQQSAQRQAHQRAVQTAQAELNAEQAALTKTDPLYPAKQAIILKILLPQIRAGKFQPTEWLPEFRRLYTELPAHVAARTSSTVNNGGNQPLRAQQPAGGAVAAPKSLAEAIDFGINEATRR